MSETGERGFLEKAIERAKTWIRPEVKPYTQAVPTSSNIIEHPRTRILRESQARQAKTRQKTITMNAAAAGATAIMAATGGVEIARGGQDINNITQGAIHTVQAAGERLANSGAIPDNVQETIDGYRANRAKDKIQDPTIKLEDPKPV